MYLPGHRAEEGFEIGFFGRLIFSGSWPGASTTRATRDAGLVEILAAAGSLLEAAIARAFLSWSGAVCPSTDHVGCAQTYAPESGLFIG